MMLACDSRPCRPNREDHVTRRAFTCVTRCRTGTTGSISVDERTSALYKALRVYVRFHRMTIIRARAGGSFKIDGCRVFLLFRPIPASSGAQVRARDVSVARLIR